MDQFNGNPPDDGIIGYIDSDDNNEFSEDEAVYIGDTIEPGVVVHTLCYNW
jgi:hypothetical protein